MSCPVMINYWDSDNCPNVQFPKAPGMSHRSRFILISQTSWWTYLNPHLSAWYVFLPKFPYSKYYPISGGTRRLVTSILGREQNSIRRVSLEASGTAGEALNGRQLAGSLFSLCWIFFCVQGDVPLPHPTLFSKPFLILFYNTHLFSGTEFFYWHHKHHQDLRTLLLTC